MEHWNVTGIPERLGIPRALRTSCKIKIARLSK